MFNSVSHVLTNVLQSLCPFSKEWHWKVNSESTSSATIISRRAFVPTSQEPKILIFEPGPLQHRLKWADTGWYKTLVLWTFLELYPQEKWVSYQNMYISTLGYQVLSPLTIFFSNNLTRPPAQLDKHFGFFLKVLALCYLQKNPSIALSYSATDKKTNILITISWNRHNTML